MSYYACMSAFVSGTCTELNGSLRRNPVKGAAFMKLNKTIHCSVEGNIDFTWFPQQQSTEGPYPGNFFCLKKWYTFT